MSELEPASSNLTRLDRLIVVLIALLLLFCPLALGTVERWSEQIFITTAAVIGLLTSIRLARGGIDVPMRWPVAIPLIGFPILVAIQLIPAPALAAAISPAAIGIRKELLGGILAEEDILRAAAISMYAEETRRHLGLLLGVIAVFVAARVVARSRRAIRWLLVCMCLAGIIVGAVALTHQIVRLDKIYGVIGVPRNITRAAPFINPSHFSQFMNLSLGAALALLLKSISAVRRDRSPGTWADWVDLMQQGQLTRLILPLVTIVIALAGVATSGSRGGVLAFAVAGVFTAVVAGTKRRARGVAVGITLLLVVGLIAMLALSDTLSDRVAQLKTGNIGGERLTLLRGQADLWRLFPLLGTGLGTFQWVFPRYDHTHPINIASHAENEYAQLMTETGAIGVLLVLVFLFTLWRAYAAAVRDGGRRGAIALGLGFGLAAVCLHSLIDFGQHLPANAAMTAVAAACVLAAATARSDERTTTRASVNWIVVPMFALVAALAWMSWQADSCRRAASASRSAAELSQRLARDNWIASDDDFAVLLRDVDESVRLRPNDAEFAYGQAWAQYWSVARNGEGRIPPSVNRAAVESVIDRYQRAMQLCPTFGPPYSMAGQLAVWLGDTPRGQMLLDRAMELSPQDGMTAAFNAELALRRGDDERALGLFGRAVATAAISGEDVVRRLIADYNRADLAMRFADGKRWYLESAVNELRRKGRTAEAREALDAMHAVMRAAADEPDAPADVLYDAAHSMRSRDDAATALPYLRRAVARRPTELAWRFELAQLLLELNQTAAAVEELNTVLRDKPDWPGARELRSELSRRATTRPTG